MMDQRIFDQLEVLERGARYDPRVRGRDARSNPPARPYRVTESAVEETTGHRQHYDFSHQGFESEEMILDSFGKIQLE